MANETRGATGTDKGGAAAELSPELEYLMPPKKSFCAMLCGDCDPNLEMKKAMNQEESLKVNKWLNIVRGLRIVTILTGGACHAVPHAVPRRATPRHATPC